MYSKALYMHRLQMNHQIDKGVDHCWTFFYVDQVKSHWVQSGIYKCLGTGAALSFHVIQKLPFFYIFNFLQTNKNKSQNHL